MQRRIDRIKQLAEEFNLNQTKIGEYAERSRTTVTKVFGGQDERYLTERNVAAIEPVIERIPGEYRRKLLEGSYLAMACFSWSLNQVVIG